MTQPLDCTTVAAMLAERMMELCVALLGQPTQRHRDEWRYGRKSSLTHGLGIAEGIETALSVLSIGWEPVWAATCADTLRRFPLLPGIDCLTIFADNDRTGLGAAEACAARWIAAGHEARILKAPRDGQDFSDLWHERAARERTA